MKLAPLIANIFFFGSVLICYFSGNEKAPYIVLTAAFASLFSAVALLIAKRKRIALLTAIPFLYTTVVFILSRQGLIDPILFLGFR